MARKKVLIIGLGRLGAGVAERASAKGEDVIAIDKDAGSLLRLDDTFTGFTVTGDATDIAFLEEEGMLDSVREAIVTTGNDNVNLFLAHVLSSIYQIPEIFVRFDDPDKGACLAGFSNIRPIYPFELSLMRLDALEGEDEE